MERGMSELMSDAEQPCVNWMKRYDRTMGSFGLSFAGEWSLAINDCGLYVFLPSSLPSILFAFPHHSFLHHSFPVSSVRQNFTNNINGQVVISTTCSPVHVTKARILVLKRQNGMRWGIVHFGTYVSFLCSFRSSRLAMALAVEEFEPELIERFDEFEVGVARY